MTPTSANIVVYANFIHSLSPCQIWLRQFHILTLISAQNRQTSHMIQAWSSVAVWVWVQQFSRLNDTVVGFRQQKQQVVQTPCQIFYLQYPLVRLYLLSWFCSSMRLSVSTRFAHLAIAWCDKQLFAHRTTDLFHKMPRKQSFWRWLSADFGLSTLYNVPCPLMPSKNKTKITKQ